MATNPSVYIPAADTLLDHIDHVVLPDDHELQAALGVLAQSPVASYAPFTEAEISLLGAYRAFVSQAGGYESIWSSIVEGDWNAWIYAIHWLQQSQQWPVPTPDACDTAARFWQTIRWRELS